MEETVNTTIHTKETIYKTDNATLLSVPYDLIDDDENSRFITIPLGILFCIILLSAMVFLIARNRRHLAHIYCNQATHRNSRFHQAQQWSDDSADSDFDLDDPTKCLLRGKLQINNMRYESYQTLNNTNSNPSIMSA